MVGSADNATVTAESFHPTHDGDQDRMLLQHYRTLQLAIPLEPLPSAVDNQ